VAREPREIERQILGLKLPGNWNLVGDR
jgi:hypothetical protein